jgi:hypothetical protein
MGHQEKLSKEDLRLAYRAMARRADLAQRDISTFFEMVIRHEITKKPLHTAPHQKVLFSFVQAHDRIVLRLAVDTAKTFSSTAMALWLMGNDVTQRGAIVSHSQNQAKKVLRMIKDYIEDESLGAALRVVFPYLKKAPTSNRVSWKQNEITIERPAGTRDPSVVAHGIGGKIMGARLSWLLFDDLLDDTNTHTQNERENVERKINYLISRMDLNKSKVVFCNTPWDRGDATYYLEEKAGWPALTMDIDGFIRFSNAKAVWMQHALDNYLRPSNKRAGGLYDWYRLTAHDPDPNEETTLWPERHLRVDVEQKRETWLPHEFARLMMCEPFDEDALRCQRDWVEHCKRLGIGTSLVSHYDGSNPTFTGVDLAIGKKIKHDKTAFFTYELLPDRKKRLLDIETGRFTGPEIVDKIIEKTDAYKSIVGVETNSCQDYVRQFALEKRKDLQVRAHSTQYANKLSQEFGIESIFAEFKNEGWIIPCNGDGTCDPEVQEWINQCLYYQPHAHTGDILIASWIASEMSRRIRRNKIIGSVGRPRLRTGQF